MSVENANDVRRELSHSPVSPRLLHHIWDRRLPPASPDAVKSGEFTHGQIPWMQEDVAAVGGFAERALEAQEYRLVCDLAAEAARLKAPAGDGAASQLLRVRLLHARALTRLGSIARARKELKSALAQAERTASPLLQAEIFNLMGEVASEEAHLLPSGTLRHEALKEAVEHYLHARQLDETQLQPLLCAAIAARLLGDLPTATSSANEALLMAAAMEKQQGPTFASIEARATAHAVLENYLDAGAEYRQLHSAAGQTTRGLAEARYRSESLAKAAGKPRDLFHDFFPRLQLVVFAGHKPSSGQGPERFPLSRVAEVRESIRQQLERIGARAGLGSPAAGADLLFADELLRRQASLHVVLPWSRDEFLRSSVSLIADAPAPEESWRNLFEYVLREATSTSELGQMYEPADMVGWQYVTEVTCGLAVLTAKINRLDLQPLVLWDGDESRPGGATNFVKFWRRFRGEEPLRIELPPLDASASVSIAATAPMSAASPAAAPAEFAGWRTEQDVLRQEVKTILYADFVGYSRMPERVMPHYIRRFMPEVARLAGVSRYAPVSINTWGNAVHAVFDFAHDAGCFALELVQMIRERETEWEEAGLLFRETRPDGATITHPLSIRVGLHTGPVFLHYDPIVRRIAYTGAHVNRAARIEPMAEYGEVYASEEFAAFAALDAEITPEEKRFGEATKGIACEYVGSMRLAKSFPGLHRLYRVLARRTLDIEKLAQAIHLDYCTRARARGQTADTRPALQDWAELPKKFQDSNRDQAGDIPFKMKLLKYELTPLEGVDPRLLPLSPEQLDMLARHEHERWADFERRAGTVWGQARDAAHNPFLVAWEQLPESERENNREIIRNAFRLLGEEGFRLRALVES